MSRARVLFFLLSLALVVPLLSTGVRRALAEDSGEAVTSILLVVCFAVIYNGSASSTAGSGTVFGTLTPALALLPLDYVRLVRRKSYGNRRRLILDNLQVDLLDRCVPVRNLPKTTSGKLQRRKLAAAYLAGEFAAEIEAAHYSTYQRQ